MEVVHNYFAEITATITFIVWLIRLEGKVKYQKEEIEMLRERIDEFSGIYKKLSEIAERLSYIEGCFRSISERE